MTRVSTATSPCVTWIWSEAFPPPAGSCDHTDELYRTSDLVPIVTRTFIINPQLRSNWC